MRLLFIAGLFSLYSLQSLIAEVDSANDFDSATSLLVGARAWEQFYPISSTDLRPAAAFSIAMEDAFLTPMGIALKLRKSADVTTWLKPTVAARNSGRRVRSILGILPGATGTTTANAPGAGSFSVAQNVAVPEPGNFLTGLLLLGFCASGFLGRRHCADGIRGVRGV